LAAKTIGQQEQQMLAGRFSEGKSGGFHKKVCEKLVA